ncbi:hypothetical protein HK102_007768, partial [Quaeritorhiza haematococci]
MDDLEAAIQARDMDTLRNFKGSPASKIRSLSALCSFDPQNGIEYMNQALTLDPTHPVILNNLGYLYHRQLGDTERAIEYYLKCLASDPKCRIAYLGLSDLYHSLGLTGPESALLSQGVREFPNDTELWNQFGVCQITSQVTTVAYLHSIFDHAERLCSDGGNGEVLSKIYINKGHLENQLGNFRDSIRLYTKALQLDPQNFLAIHNILLNLHYLPDFCDELASLCEWVDCPMSSSVHATIRELHFCMVRLMTTKRSSSGFCPKKGRQPSFGFVSGDFNDHAVSHFAQGLIKELAKSFTAVLYSTSAVLPRGYTGCLLRSVHHLTTEQAIETVEKDNVHVLVDLSGHTFKNRLDIFLGLHNVKLVSAIGYPNDVGIPGMYRLCDDFTDPDVEPE